MKAFATEEADRRYDQVLRLMPGGGPRRLEVLLEAIDPNIRYDTTPLTVSFASEARELARTLEDPVSEARAILLLEHARWIDGDTTGAIRLCREALALVHDRDGNLEAVVLSRLSRLLHFAGEWEEAQSLVERGIVVAKTSGNMSALSGLYGTQLISGQFGAEWDAVYDAAAVAAREAKDPLRELNLVTNAGYISLWWGDFSKSGEALAQARELAIQIAPSDRYPIAGEAWLLSLLGRYAESEQLALPLSTSSAIPTRIVALTALYEGAERRGDTDVAAIAEELWAAAQLTGESQRSVPALAAWADSSC